MVLEYSIRLTGYKGLKLGAVSTELNSEYPISTPPKNYKKTPSKLKSSKVTKTCVSQTCCG